MSDRAEDRQAEGSAERVGFPRSFVHGLNAAVAGNAQAFGFSITITVTYGVVGSGQAGKPSLAELMGFALSAVASFALLNLLVAELIGRAARGSEPTRVVLVATATDFLAVGCGVAAAIGIREVVGGWGTWVLAPLCAALVYVLVQAVELAVGLREARRGDE